MMLCVSNQTAFLAQLANIVLRLELKDIPLMKNMIVSLRGI